MKTTMMNKEYKYFEFCQIFNYQRGRRLITQNQITGDTAYISSTALNNGLDNYITPPDYMVVHKDRLTLSNSGSVGYLFYHDYEFVASDHVTVIWLKNRDLNKYMAMFLKPVFEKIKYRYNFGREISNDRIIKEKIYLPIDDYGKPDWAYMENHVKSLEHKVQFKKIKTKRERQYKSIDMSNWKEFKFIDKNLWTRIKHGERLIEVDRIKGEIPYYSASEYNNSLTDTIDNPLFIEKDCIVYSTFGTAFWVDGEFTASDEIYAFHNPHLNKYNALFITTIMKQNQYKFKFGRKAFRNKFQNEAIKLPTTPTGKPDWQFMENYIKSLPYRDNL
jgi:hypothetical protein